MGAAPVCMLLALVAGGCGAGRWDSRGGAAVLETGADAMRITSSNGWAIHGRRRCCLPRRASRTMRL